MNRLSTAKTLFLTFAKIGAFTFGGGYAMLRLIEHEVAQKHKWISQDELLDIIAISESTPGPISVNCATFIGYRMAGLFGAAAATLGVVLPSFLIICVLAGFIKQYTRIQWLRWAFEGVRAGVSVLVFSAALSLGGKCPRDTFTAIVLALAFVCAAFFNVSAILMLVVAAAAGILRQLAITRRERKEEKGEQP